MSILKKFAFLFLIVLMMSIIVYADHFTVSVEVIDDKITKDEAGNYSISISNNEEEFDSFRIFSLNYPDWDIYTDPIQNPIIVGVPSHSTKSVVIHLDPLNDEIVGAYRVPIHVQSLLTEEKEAVDLTVFVTSPKTGPGQYTPTVIADVDAPSQIDPRQKISIKVKLANQNILDFPQLTIVIDSNLIKDRVNVALGPKEEKTVEITRQIDPLTPPQKDTLVVNIVSGNATIAGPISDRIEIKPYKNIKQDIVSENQFLRVKKSITFTNNANSRYKGTVKVETTSLRALFSSTEPEAKITKDAESKYLEWDIELDPSQSKIVYLNENYYLLFVIIAVIVVFVVIYFLTRTPLVIVKSAANIHKKEGGISELKVILHLKNRGREALHQLEIKDKIPHLASIEKGVTIGTLHPTKILKHENKGTVIVWHIESLDASEERVINYKVLTNLSILGGFTLPAALCTFKSQGVQRSSHSNRLTVSE